MKFKTLITLLAAATLTGCVGSNTKPYVSAPNHSEAYNMARAGGINDIKDLEVSQEDYRTFETTYLTSRNTLALMSPSGLGMSFGKGFGLGLVAAMLAPDTPANRNSLIAWMPASEAETPEAAAIKLGEYGKAAIEEALREIGATPLFVPNTVYKPKRNEVNISFFLSGSEIGCPTPEETKSYQKRCFVVLKVFWPDLIGNPDFIASTGHTWAFQSDDDVDFNRIAFKDGSHSRIPHDQFYAAVSRRLPEWAALYLAPKKVRLASGEKNRVPVLLQEGKSLYFITPKQKT